MTPGATASRSDISYASLVDLEFEGPEPTYTTNPPFTGTCDLSLYRRTPSEPQLPELQRSGGANPQPDGSADSPAGLSRKSWLGRKSWNSVKAFMDVKCDESLSPFSMDIDDPDFLSDTKNAKGARKELTQVAGEIMLGQHRCFLYSVTVVGHYARLIGWDRSGALVSEPIDLREDGDKLLAFIYALGHMDDHALGRDPTATLATEAEMKLWQNAVTAKLKADADWKNVLEQAIDDDWPLYKLRSFSLLSEGSRSPFRRGCKGFIALDVATGEFVHLKDFWYADDLERPPEFIVYARLVEAGVRNIPTFLYDGDVPGDVSANAQTTLNHEFDGHLQWYTHGQFVVREVGKPVESYENTRQLTTVFPQVLTAHQDAWDNAGLLHGDINDRSIVIHKGHCLLTD
ncbi:hypothetical protein BC629DRAFT_1594637 [Irpex lacteus]|nr:hypothetical protein BC629DRAFT_1594637 [Irpex lacteus]